MAAGLTPTCLMPTGFLCPAASPSLHRGTEQIHSVWTAPGFQRPPPGYTGTTCETPLGWDGGGGSQLTTSGKSQSSSGNSQSSSSGNSQSSSSSGNSQSSSGNSQSSSSSGNSQSSSGNSQSSSGNSQSSSSGNSQSSSGGNSSGGNSQSSRPGDRLLKVTVSEHGGGGGGLSRLQLTVLLVLAGVTLAVVALTAGLVLQRHCRDCGHAPCCCGHAPCCCGHAPCGWTRTSSSSRWQRGEPECQISFLNVAEPEKKKLNTDVV
ncbi:corneodesmosin-like [Perca fluviatilis]|uniref:corneodesmosin-like n=1 Tax=Perca fluviatilis TaxID=8168 RepID=UPI0019636422|nr:corneodesmosin-like [Perca fluviatilis]